jgi:activator of 2-hydroxyglutaryl-CoA dehydratase
MTVKKVRERDIIKMKDNIMLLIDIGSIGSTFTKVVVVDLDSEEIISRIASPSMVREDVTIGIRKALGKVEEEIGNLKGKEIIACSSAAGGLQVVSIRVQ